MDAARPILLVEDNPKDVELTLEALALAGIRGEVVVLRDGAQALDYLLRRGAHADREAIDPCVILLDLKLPKVDGLEVLATVKADKRLRTIPVVMLTASKEESDVVASYDLGTNAYVVKPLGFSEFLLTVRELGAFWGVLNLPPRIFEGTVAA